MARSTSSSASKSNPQTTPIENQAAKYAAPKKLPLAQSLLARAHSPDTATSIFVESAVRRPLILRPTSKDDVSTNARDARQRAREAKVLADKRRKRKPQPLSAVQKRKLGLYEIPKAQRKWQNFVGLNKLWAGYMRDVLGWSSNNNNSHSHNNKNSSWRVEARAVGPLIASADLHGAEVEVVRCRCVGRVGIAGIVVKDTKETFEIITRKDELKTVPKEYTTFRIRIPLSAAVESQTAMTDLSRPSTSPAPGFVAFELQGSQFAHRPAERSTKKIKLHLPPDI